MKVRHLHLLRSGVQRIDSVRDERRQQAGVNPEPGEAEWLAELVPGADENHRPEPLDPLPVGWSRCSGCGASFRNPELTSCCPLCGGRGRFFLPEDDAA